MNQQATLEKIVSLCKRRGFVYQTAELYGGINGAYDFGHLGTLMKQNIRNAWLQSIQQFSENILLLEGALLNPQEVWIASGHVENFHDPLVDCLNCKHRFRADDIDLERNCPSCGVKAWTDVRQFNLMFQTNVGATTEKSSIAYLRPETAQSIFVQFKNIISTNRVKLPFGVAQIGKAFRNEITPKQFVFRSREFEQMEIEWFCKADDAPAYFDAWCTARLSFFYDLGITKENIRLRPHAPSELAHYSKQCKDVEYEFPFGWKELEGIAHRGNFDLTQHGKHAGKELAIHNEETNETVVPDVVECSVGVDRLFLTLMMDAYREDTVEGETRVLLALSPKIAPIKAAFFPLTKQQVEPTYELFKKIQKQLGLPLQFDKTGSIGKRYRRQDEIGTPLCITYDFETESTQTVTVRHRDTTKQERIPLDQLASYILKTVHGI